MQHKQTILIIEDDPKLRQGITFNFEHIGYHVLQAADGVKGLELAFNAKPDLIILDIMLPGYNGLEILQELRERQENVAVLILSARNQINDKIKGLETGADDYMTKPFELAELIARVKAMLRRQTGFQAKKPILQFKNLSIDLNKRSISKNGIELSLSTKEFNLLVLLAKNPGRPFTREQILDKIWGWDFTGTSRTVDNFILALRQKLESEPTRPRFIKTVRQIGYKFQADQDDGKHSN